MTNNAGDAVAGRGANSIARVLNGERTRRFGLTFVDPGGAAQVKPVNRTELF
jgi:hypothetical protein